MPVVPQLDWTETETDLSLVVSLNQASVKGVDIEVTDAFVKVNAAPYLLALDLFEDVDSARASVELIDGKLNFVLPKVLHLLISKKRLWRRLRAKGEKSEILQRRRASLEKFHEKLRATQKASSDQRKADIKLAADKKIETERTKREMIAAAKENELQKQRQALLEWKQNLNVESSPTTSMDSTSNLLFESTEVDREHCFVTKEVSTGVEDAHKPIASSRVGAPRRTFLEPVQVDFTELQTSVLPARETREKELKLYKMQQQLKNSSEMLSISDRHPQYLKEKADAFYKQGNYQSAINAYSDAIEADPGAFRCFANRAASYFAIEEYSACVADCNTVLEILKPQIEDSDAGNEELEDLKKIMCKVLQRRSVSNLQLGNEKEAQIDINKARE